MKYMTCNITSFKANIQVNEMIFKNITPSIQLSSNGNLLSYRPWREGPIKWRQGPTDMHALVKQRDATIDDVMTCVKANPDLYVSLVGYDKNNAVQCLYVISSPYQ